MDDGIISLIIILGVLMVIFGLSGMIFICSSKHCKIKNSVSNDDTESDSETV